MIPSRLPSGSDLGKLPGASGRRARPPFPYPLRAERRRSGDDSGSGGGKVREIPELPNIEWLNMGGGHHITRPDYDIARLERCILHIKETYGVPGIPGAGEAIALNAGYLVTEVMDIVENGSPLWCWTLRRPVICRMCWKCPTGRPLRIPGSREGVYLPPVLLYPAWPGM